MGLLRSATSLFAPRTPSLAACVLRAVPGNGPRARPTGVFADRSMLMAASLSGGILTVAGDNNGVIHDAITVI